MPLGKAPKPEPETPEPEMDADDPGGGDPGPETAPFLSIAAIFALARMLKVPLGYLARYASYCALSSLDVTDCQNTSSNWLPTPFAWTCAIAGVISIAAVKIAAKIGKYRRTDTQTGNAV